MKRVLTIFIVLAAVITLAAAPALAQQKKAEPAKKPAEFKCEDPIGVVKIKKGDPIHIANWMVVVGPNQTLGTDTKRGVELRLMTSGESSSAIQLS